MNKFFTMLSILGILYLVFQHHTNSKKHFTNIGEQQNEAAEPAPNSLPTVQNNKEEVSGTFVERTISNIFNNILKTPEGQQFLTHLFRPTNQAITGTEYSFKVNDDIIQSAFQILTIGDTNKGPAICGHLVTVFYQIYDAKNVLQEEKLITYGLGNDKFSYEFDSVIVGMHEGQTREAKIPYAKLSEMNVKPTPNYHVKITLKKIITNQYIQKEDIKIFDNEIAYKKPLICGHTVTFDAKITRGGDGTVILDTIKEQKPISMKVGDSTYPMIFSYALFGKIAVGTRTVLATKKDFIIMNKDKSLIINNMPANDNEYLILELSNFIKSGDPIH